MIRTTRKQPSRPRAGKRAPAPNKPQPFLGLTKKQRDKLREYVEWVMWLNAASMIVTAVLAPSPLVFALFLVSSGFLGLLHYGLRKRPPARRKRRR